MQAWNARWSHICWSHNLVGLGSINMSMALGLTMINHHAGYMRPLTAMEHHGHALVLEVRLRGRPCGTI